MTVVVDASVCIKWVLAEPDSDAAEALLEQELVAPALWIVEAANVLWKRARRGELTAGEVKARLEELARAPITTLGIEDDILAASELACRLDHPVYDCLYLAAALREGCHVVTADRRFVAAAAGDPTLQGRVQLLAEAAEPSA
jgi:predicted nucleic acid-binding protein